MPSDQAETERPIALDHAIEGNRGDESAHIIAIGSKAAILGSLIGLVGNLIHPATPIDDPQGVARTISDSDTWFAIHFGIVIGITLMFGGLIALYHSIRGGLAGALARFGLCAAAVGITVGLILLILDGVAAKQLADEWAAATAETRFSALQNVLTNESMNFALASLFNFIFAGVTFILFGMAVALSDVYPRWLGWVVVAAGLVSIAASLVQGVPGEPTTLSWILTIIGPTVITLWLLTIGVLMGRKASPTRGIRKAYWINNFRSVSDPHQLAEYIKLAGPVMRRSGGRFLARGRPAKVYEAGVTERTIVIEFDSADQAIAAYESPGYQDALRALGDGAERDLRIVEATSEA